MRIILEIPKELEEDFKKDKFEDFFCRIKANIDNRLYEKEKVQMLMKTFKDSTKYSVKGKTDPLSHDYYLDIETSEWDEYDDEFVHQTEYINYCPWCGRKLNGRKD